ncbi:hypothetical protein [Lactobacillus sp. PV034]|uniref:DUF1659 domain-containing protein n=1 Tax=Lactobacillus sp. PV034 TaxID=2594495 RepID=UPI0022409A35|nr:hypothetical protein [Lactobacillus sp. PV034]QNQ81011.1 hypothetical protein FP432_05315 [Lactobacillus sp. PV034]
MNLVEQSIQYTFAGDKYKDNKKKRVLKNVNVNAENEKLIKVGKAISSLQKDDGLVSAVLIQHHELEVSTAE